MTDLSAHAARGGMITILFQLAKVALMFASTIVLARLLSPVDFGLIAMVTAIIGVAEIFRDFGLSMAALQAKVLSHAQQSNLFWINAGVGLALSTIACAVSGPIAMFYDEPLLQPIVLACSAVFVLGGLTTQFRVKINRELRFLSLAWSDIVPYAVAFAVATTLALWGAGYWALVAQQLVTVATALALSVVLSGWRPSLPRRGQDMGGLMNFGMSFAATQFLSYLTRNIDSIAIGRVWGAVPLGMYDRAYQLVMAPLSQINTPLSRVAIPILSRLTEDPPRYESYLRRAQLIATYVTSTVFLIVAGAGAPLVRIVLGDNWAFAGLLLSVLAVGGVFRSINQIAYWMYMSKGLAAQQLRFFLVAQPLVIAVTLAGLPWGALGVAIGNSVGFAAYWVASLLWAGRCAGIDVRPLMADALRVIGTVGLPAGGIALASTLLLSTDIARVVVGVLGALAWCGIAVLVIRPVRRDARILARFIRTAAGRGNA